jgi:hypothetical protein
MKYVVGTALVGVTLLCGRAMKDWETEDLQNSNNAQ